MLISSKYCTSTIGAFIGMLTIIGIWHIVALAVEQAFPSRPKAQFIAYAIITLMGVVAAFAETKLREDENKRCP